MNTWPQTVLKSANFLVSNFWFLVLATMIANIPLYSDTPSSAETIAAEQVNNPGAAMGGDR